MGESKFSRNVHLALHPPAAVPHGVMFLTPWGTAAGPYRRATWR
jgi:hypothetical protein